MRTNPLISIIVPVYGVENYLNNCVKTLVRQTYSNLEILLIDDGSKDKCPEMCDHWAKLDNRVKVIHTANYGVSHARNMGIDAATGDFIGFVDPDDWIELDMYEQMMHYLKQSNADIHGGGFILEKENESILSLQPSKPCVFSQKQAIMEMFTLKEKPLLMWSLCDKLISRRVIGNLRLDEKLKLSEDQWFLWQIMQHVNSYSYAPQFAYHYRMRTDSATHTLLERGKGTFIDAMQRIVRDASNMDPEIQHLLKMKYLQTILGVLKRIVISGNHNFDDVLIKGQRELRKNPLACLKENNLSKLGVLYMSFPYRMVWALRPLLTKLKKEV